MARFKDEEKTTCKNSILRRILRRYLHCDRCPPNKGCNAIAKRFPRQDKYKDKRKGKA